MSERKELGKITAVRFGRGGYQDCMMSLDLSFGGEWGGVGTTVGGVWDPATMECGRHCKWTEADRDAQLAKMCREISKLMADAKVADVAKLLGKPVEVTFENYSTLKSFRILTEVL
jgi:hypothetical protein